MSRHDNTSTPPPDRVFETHHDAGDATRRSVRAMSALPSVLAHRAVGRLRGLSAVVGIAYGIGWLFKTAVEGHVADEFGNPSQFGPPTLIIVACATMFALTRGRRIAPGFLANAGLVFEVVVAYAMTLAQYSGAFIGLDTAQMNHDTVGMNDVVLWMFLYNSLIPAPPRRALIALLVSGAAPALVYAASVSVGDAPPLEAGQFFFILIFPYAGCAAAAYFAQRIIYRLGRDVTEARQMGSYRLEARLGRGGMGEVWRAQHRMLARPAAIKLIRHQAIGTDPASVEVALQRFEREAQVTAGLQSPHTVELYDFGTNDEGMLYYVMELLEGVDLMSLVERHGPLPPERVIHILLQACASLEEAHARGLVHRDIKPANIYLCHFALRHDFVKVLDFGLVKRRTAVEGDPGLTGTGAVTGTPSFLAPEIATGDCAVDGRADLYALGCVAFWLLTGRMVFDETSPVRAILAHVSEVPDPPSRHAELAVPEALDAAILCCLAKSPADRPATASELSSLLQAIELPDAWSTDRASRWWAAHDPTASVSAQI